MLIGGIYFLVGGSYAVLDLPQPTLEPYSFAITSVLTIKVWGYVWALCGLYGMFAGLVHRKKWDRHGFVVLTIFSALWAALAICSGLFDGHWRGLISGLIYAAFAGVLAITSGMK
jgi:hypothetical protein